MKILGELEVIRGSLQNFDVHDTAANISFQIVINRWNQLDQRTDGASSIIVFKGHLNKIRETRMSFFVD